MQPQKDEELIQPLPDIRQELTEAGRDQHFREFADSAPGMLWVTQADGRCTFLSRGWYEFTAQTEEEALGLGWTNAVHPDDREWAGLLFLESNARREPFQCEYRLRRADGVYRWALDIGRPRFSRSGDYLGYVGSVIEVHERKQAEQELRSSQSRLDLALNAGRMGTWELDLSTGMMTCSEECKRNYGRLPDDSFTYTELAASVHEDDREMWRKTVEDSVMRSAGLDVEYRTCWPDGSIHWVLVRATCTADAAGRTVGMAGISLDITDRKRSEEKTKRRAFQLQMLADIANRINSAHDVNSVLGVVTEEARILLGAHQAATTMVLNAGHPQPINVVSNSAKYPSDSAPPDIDALTFYEAINMANEPIRLTRAELNADRRWRKLGKFANPTPTLSGWLAVPLMGRNGKIMGLIQLSDKFEGDFSDHDEAILVQLSQLTSIAIQNARLYQELRANDERKDEFLAMLAHELRNPLAAISNAVRLAKASAETRHVDWSMDVITRQMQHLSRLIDDLMDVSRITRGKIDLKRDVMDATPILESAAATVRTLVEERKHTLELAIDRENGLWVNVDPTRLEQVVVNLLNNAAKYSENAGHIRLSAGKDENQVVISIKDKGIGIPPEKLPEMFEMFAQGDRTLARSEGGLGIGLTVVKKLVEMHGGTITAKSKGLGKGSEFIIRLPVAKQPAKTRQTAASSPDEVGSKARILVVDDNVDTAIGMARLMRLLGHEVATAHNGPEAIETAKNFHPEFIMLDIGLPGMSGYEVATQLRQEECCRDAVIVAVSGYGQDEDRRRSRAAGFDHHLVKPLDHDALISLLAEGGEAR